MKTKYELIILAKMQDPEPELYKMSYGQIERIKEKIEQLVNDENDDSLFSILMRLKSHIMIVEDWVRDQDINKAEKLYTIQQVSSYTQNQIGRDMIYA